MVSARGTPNTPTPPRPPKPQSDTAVNMTGNVTVNLVGAPDVTTHLKAIERRLSTMEDALSRLEANTDSLGPDLQALTDLVTGLKETIEAAATDNTTKDVLIAELQAQIAAEGPAVDRITAAAEKIGAFDTGADTLTTP